MPVSDVEFNLLLDRVKSLEARVAELANSQGIGDERIAAAVSNQLSGLRPTLGDAVEGVRDVRQRMDAFEARQAAAVEAVKAGVADIAWAKANDAITVRWDQWVRYTDTRLFNVFHNRIMTALERRNLIPSGWRRASPTVYNGPEPEPE